MSHIVQAKTSIVQPNLEMLRQACEIVASEHEGGQVKDHITDFYGRPVPVQTQLAVYSSVLHRGIGILISPDGNMRFTGDDWGVRQQYQAIQSEIVQIYTALVVAKALQEMGYTTQVGQQDEQCIIQGVVYA